MAANIKFIAFEGLDGAGKSTLIESLRQIILDKGEGVRVTREPGGTALGENIRRLLLSREGDLPTPRAELLMYIADRAHHVEKVIKPTLERGDWVLCDRFSASTVAFQVGGRGLRREEIDWLNNYAINGCEPDLWVLLDLSTEEACRRMQGRELDRFEGEEQAFHQRVRESYLAMARQDQEKWLVIDASMPKAVLADKLLNELRRRKWL